MVFALGIGFSSGKSGTLPFAAHVDALPLSDGITMDILRAFQGMGVAAAIPAAVRYITFLFLVKRDPHRYYPSWALWPTRSLPRARDPPRSQLSPPVPLSVALSVISLEVSSPNLARVYPFSMHNAVLNMHCTGSTGVQRFSYLLVYRQYVCSVA
jgi:hypothetical protein